MLFKSLVILKEDRLEEPAAEDILAQPSQATSQEKPETTDPGVPSPPSHAPLLPKKSACLCVPSSLEKDLFQEGSNFMKIVQALKLEGLVQSVVLEDQIQDAQQIQHMKHVWAVGIPQGHEVLRSLKQTEILYSPNPETLRSVEEKRAMFDPLKDFAAKL